MHGETRYEDSMSVTPGGASVMIALAEGAARPKFDGFVMRRIATEPVEMVCTYRRHHENPVLNLFLDDVLPSFQH